MKMILILALIVVALFVAHNYIQTGEVGLGTSLTEIEREIRSLDERLTDAIRAYRVAGRASAVGGLDESMSAGSAQDDVRRIAREAGELQYRVGTDREKQRLADLEARIRDAKRQMGLN